MASVVLVVPAAGHCRGHGLYHVSANPRVFPVKGSESYFGLVDMIFEKQSEWVTGEVAEVVDKLKRIGKTSGLTNEDLEVCLQDTANARALVEAYRLNSGEDNIQSTPSFVINGKLHSNMDYDDLVSIINKELN